MASRSEAKKDDTLMKRKIDNHVTSKARMKKYDDWDASIPTKEGRWNEMCRLKCTKCGSGPKLSIGFYAFTRGPNWRLICCNCPGKSLWWRLTDV